jgi:hypothetical protein
MFPIVVLPIQTDGDPQLLLVVAAVVAFVAGWHIVARWRR